MSKHTKKCPHCGASIPADAKVCRKCGESLVSGRIETLPQQAPAPVQEPEKQDVPAASAEENTPRPAETSADWETVQHKKSSGNPWRLVAALAVIVVIVIIAVVWAVNGNQSTDEAEATPVLVSLTPAPAETPTAETVAETDAPVSEADSQDAPEPVEDTVSDTPTPDDGTEADALPEGTEGSVIITDAANLRTGPGTEYEVAAVAAEGSYLPLMGTEGSWCLVVYEEQELYVHESLVITAVDPDAADVATVTATDAVNVRSGPSAEYDVLGTAAVGETMPTSGQTASGWYHVIYNGQSGFVAGAYVQYNG